MRFILALILFSAIAPFAGAEDREAGQADFSSNWAHEDGFEVSAQKRSRAEFFLNAIMPQETPKKPTVTVDQSTATATGDQ